MSLTQSITQLIEPAVTEAGFYLEEVQLTSAGSHRIWSDGGTIELDALYLPYQKYFAQRMAAKGYREGVDYIEASYPNTGHSELWWAGRVEHPINWWLDPNEPRTSIEERRWVGKPQS